MRIAGGAHRNRPATAFDIGWNANNKWAGPPAARGCRIKDDAEEGTINQVDDMELGMVAFGRPVSYVDAGAVYGPVCAVV